MKNTLHDTIAAITTPLGEGGISVIRISGADAFKITGQVFSRDKDNLKKLDASKENSHTIHFGYIFDNCELLDEVLVSIFKNPHSYTGEDVIEISSHGGTLVTQKILTLLLSRGARHAEPGEFTKRAFLNAKIDLSQAEAVADLIRAKTDAAHSSSIKQLEGSLSGFVKKTRQDIINLTSLVELELDFAEEDLEFVKKDELKQKILDLADTIDKIIASYITGKVIREGVDLVIAGKPNSGKSSLFNYLLKTNRAIVSNIAGTTRDYIEESLIINGVMFNLIDTAGLRASEDAIESEGIKRSYKKIEEADLILYLIDASRDENNINEDIEYYKKNFSSGKSILVFSKLDLVSNASETAAEDGAIRNLAPTANVDSVAISLLNDASIEELKSHMSAKALSGNTVNTGSSIVLTNLRHRLCLERVNDALRDAARTIDDRMSGEYISVDLRNAMHHLGEITGEVTNDEILNNIFGKFCIGK
jgi:tRNA modification GTPase